MCRTGDYMSVLCIPAFHSSHIGEQLALINVTASAAARAHGPIYRLGVQSNSITVKSVLNRLSAFCFANELLKNGSLFLIQSILTNLITYAPIAPPPRSHLFLLVRSTWPIMCLTSKHQLSTPPLRFTFYSHREVEIGFISVQVRPGSPDLVQTKPRQLR